MSDRRGATLWCEEQSSGHSTVSPGAVRSIRESRVMAGPAGGEGARPLGGGSQMALLQGSRAEMPKAKTWDSFI